MRIPHTHASSCSLEGVLEYLATTQFSGCSGPQACLLVNWLTDNYCLSEMKAQHTIGCLCSIFVLP